VKKYGEPNLERTQKMWQSIHAAGNGGQVVCGTAAAMPHVLCVAAAQRSMPQVRQFPREMLTTQHVGEGTMICVSGLHAAIVQCYDQWILPSEHGGLSWASKGEAIHLKDDPAATSDEAQLAAVQRGNGAAADVKSAGRLSV
jgi:hypothetical protein